MNIFLEKLSWSRVYKNLEFEPIRWFAFVWEYFVLKKNNAKTRYCFFCDSEISEQLFLLKQTHATNKFLKLCWLLLGVTSLNDLFSPESIPQRQTFCNEQTRLQMMSYRQLTQLVWGRIYLHTFSFYCRQKRFQAILFIVFQDVVTSTCKRKIKLQRSSETQRRKGFFLFALTVIWVVYLLHLLFLRQSVVNLTPIATWQRSIIILRFVSKGIISCRRCRIAGKFIRDPHARSERAVGSIKKFCVESRGTSPQITPNLTFS